MTGFSAEWLALREPVDHRSRDAGLAAELADYFASRPSATVVDLGCGTGSNLRGTFALLPATQRWTLVDYDRSLLDTARRTLADWADHHRDTGDELELHKAGKNLTVCFRRADLESSLEQVLTPAPDLVTAAAFFDLCSPAFLGRLVTAVASRKAAFYTVLTYNGQQSWAPAHPADRRLLQAFHDHQRGDKGLGTAAGPAAATALATTFQAAGYDVTEGDSPWRLDQVDARLIAELASGFADAAAETGQIGADVVAAWRAVSRTSAVVGHTDTLAVPAA